MPDVIGASVHWGEILIAGVKSYIDTICQVLTEGEHGLWMTHPVVCDSACGG